MKQTFINLGISTMCFPVLTIIGKVVENPDLRNAVGAMWIGISLSCMVNGIVCLIKDSGD
jgi:hypothetical protein